MVNLQTHKKKKKNLKIYLQLNPKLTLISKQTLSKIHLLIYLILILLLIKIYLEKIMKMLILHNFVDFNKMTQIKNNLKLKVFLEILRNNPRPLHYLIKFNVRLLLVLNYKEVFNKMTHLNNNLNLKIFLEILSNNPRPLHYLIKFNVR